MSRKLRVEENIRDKNVFLYPSDDDHQCIDRKSALHAGTAGG
jgi:hypothetical protein